VGRWEIGISFSFRVQAPFYRGFWGCLFIFIAFLLYLFYIGGFIYFYLFLFMFIFVFF
jgi:hypothetical protein